MARRVDSLFVSVFRWYLPGYLVLFALPDFFGAYPNVDWIDHAILLTIIIFLNGWMLILFSVWVDGNRLVAKRFGKTIEIERENLSDWEAVSWLPVSRLYFRVDRTAGYSILFMPRVIFNGIYSAWPETDSYAILSDFKANKPLQ